MNIPEDIQQHLNDYKATSLHSAESMHLDRQRLFEMCESPIEQIFLMTMWEYTNGYPVNYQGLHLLASNFGEPFQYGYDLRIFPQYEIRVPDPDKHGSTRDYRVDFMHFVLPPCLPNNRQLPYDFHRDAIARIAVELDEHEYHERTPDQALRNRSRDRALTAAGYTTMRFTGREIHRGADAKGLELVSYIDQVVRRHIETNQLKFFPD